MKIVADPRLSHAEVDSIVKQQVQEEAIIGKEIAKIELNLEGHEIAITITHKSPIKRVRRITGYLSNIESFNDAKQAECRDRVSHGSL